MKIWIIEQGKKCGPFEEYVLRGRIQNGELNAQTRAWSEGMAAWGTLEDIASLKSEFRQDEEDRYQEETAAQEESLPDVFVREPVDLSRLYLLRRFWARLFDFMLYRVLLFGALRFSGKNLSDLMLSEWFTFLHLIPWLALEAWLISRYQTTPGKWLLGLKVEKFGHALSWRESVWRVAYVWVIGLGMGIDLLMIIGLLIWCFYTRKIGASLWDIRVGSEVSSPRIPKPAAWGGFALLILSLFALLAWITFPASMEILKEQDPEQYQEIQRRLDELK